MVSVSIRLDRINSANLTLIHITTRYYKVNERILK